MGVRQRMAGLPVVGTFLAGEPLSNRAHLILGLFLPAAVLLLHMLKVYAFTVDDAYISFRYARNLADGHGLVYNPGQRVEGYTNFAWTVWLAAGMKVGIDPHHMAKVTGMICALAALGMVYLLSRAIHPLGRTPCLATWLMATSTPFTGYAVLGLETAAFAALVTAGVFLTAREEDHDARIPWSGLLFALAGLTRPEAPLFAGLALLAAGRDGLFSRRNLLRAGVFVVPVGAHLLWRHSYYGLWVPFTFVAKTGDVKAQFGFGKAYLKDHLDHAGPLLYFALVAFAMAVFNRGRALRLTVACVVAWAGYILYVGGDWMTYFRFMAPIEPLLFVLVGVGFRCLADRADRVGILALALAVAWGFYVRREHMMEAHKKWLTEEMPFWRNTSSQTAGWLLRQPKGIVAIGDIGAVGYLTNYPVLDLLGLVDPIIGRLPGGYTRKLGRGWLDRIYGVMPDYMVFIMAGQNCNRPEMPGSKQLYRDPRFRAYELGHNVQVGPHASWCIFRLKNPRPR